MPLRPQRDITERMLQLQSDSPVDFASELNEPNDTVLKIFPDHPDPLNLHIFVRPPHNGACEWFATLHTMLTFLSLTAAPLLLLPVT
jgi:hypothetical protein